jgi:hypothetical protein
MDGGLGMSQYAFTKLFSSITKSTVWCEPHTTVRVWITFLADCDPQGHVHASIPGLANLARVTVEECETALATFLGPDPYSRTADFEGRRIEVIDGGWKLLNYDLYRGRRDDGARREQNRESQQRRRERQQASAELLTDADIPQESAQDRSQKTEVKQNKIKKEQVRSRDKQQPLSVDDLVEEGVERQHAEDWLKVRKAKEAPLTVTAWNGVKAEAAKADITPAEAVRVAAINSWGGFKAFWLESAPSKSKHTRQDSSKHGGFEERAYGEGGLL